MRKRRQAALSVELGISQHHLACAVHLARHAVVLNRCESTYQPEMKSEGAKGKARREWREEEENRESWDKIRSIFRGGRSWN